MLARERTQLGKRDRVVAAEGEREAPAVTTGSDRLLDLRRTCAPCRPARRAVAVVDDRERLDDVHAEHRVVRAQERRGGADRLGPEARPGRKLVAVSNGIP